MVISCFSHIKNISMSHVIMFLRKHPEEKWWIMNCKNTFIFEFSSILLYIYL